MSDPNAELVDSWQLSLHDRSPGTRALYRHVVDLFTRWLAQRGGPVDLLEVARSDVEAWFTGMRDLAANTRRTRWVGLRSFYRWAVEEDEIDANPMERIRVAKAPLTPIPVLEVDDVRRLLKVCEGRGFTERRDLALVRTFLATGARLAEVTALRVDDVDLTNRIVMIRKAKGGGRRIVRIDAKTAAAIDRYRRVRARHRHADTPALWLGTRGGMTISGVDSAMRRRARAAGIQGFHVHLLRHWFAHRWQTLGGNEGSLQVLGGWSDPSVMARYGAARRVDRALAHYDEVDLLAGL